MKNSTLNLRGKSGQNYVFHTYKLPAKLTSVGGVFMYLKQMKSDFKILQIRDTHDFKSEMENRDLKKKSELLILLLFKKTPNPNESKL